MNEKLAQLKKAFKEIFPDSEVYIDHLNFKVENNFFTTHKDMYERDNFFENVSLCHQDLKNLTVDKSIKASKNSVLNDILEDFVGDIYLHHKYGPDKELIDKLHKLGVETYQDSDGPTTIEYNSDGDFFRNASVEDIINLGGDFSGFEDFILEHLDDIDLEDIETSELSDLFTNHNKIDLDDLAYWTVFFEPINFDEDIAHKVGLTPFNCFDTDLLALGGCGMDLSPRLDAYQALVDGTVPSSSQFIHQPEYAKSVVGESIYEEVLKAAGASIVKLEGELK